MPDNIILLTLLISLATQLVFFILAYLQRTDKFTDFTYGLTFIILSVFALFRGTDFGVVKIILLVMIVLWAVRLITYLLYRILSIKKDSRFDEMREDFLKFLRFWVFQGISVWIIMLPSTLLLSNENTLEFETLTIFGLVIWIIGLTIETIADIQKFRFKSNRNNKGKWIASGLWAYSRHPNYFGEILCWVGVFLYTLQYFEINHLWTVISPIYIFILLRFVSGIPILEKRYDKKYKDDPEYQKYKNNTNLLILMPPKSD